MEEPLLKTSKWYGLVVVPSRTGTMAGGSGWTNGQVQASQLLQDRQCGTIRSQFDYVITSMLRRASDQLHMTIPYTFICCRYRCFYVAPSFHKAVMPLRLSLGAFRAISSQATGYGRFHFRRKFASSSDASPEIYDVVCVGGGPAGLSLLSGLKVSPVTKGLKVALIEGQDIQKNRLQKHASLDSFSNRCSSLTPASVRNLQGGPPRSYRYLVVV